MYQEKQKKKGNKDQGQKESLIKLKMLYQK